MLFIASHRDTEQATVSPSLVRIDYTLWTKKTHRMWNEMSCPVVFKVTEGFWGFHVDIWGSGVYHFLYSGVQAAMQSREKGGRVQQHHTSDHAAARLGMCCHGNRLPLTHWWGCLVCQCDSCWTDECVEDVRALIDRWCVCLRERERERERETDWCEDDMLTT